MSYVNLNGVDKTIDSVIADHYPPGRSPDIVKSSLMSILPRDVQGRVSEKVTASDIKAALTRLLNRSPHLFNFPACAIEDEVLSTPYEELDSDEAREVWRVCSIRRRNRNESIEAARRG